MADILMQVYADDRAQADDDDPGSAMLMQSLPRWPGDKPQQDDSGSDVPLKTSLSALHVRRFISSDKWGTVRSGTRLAMSRRIPTRIRLLSIADRRATLAWRWHVRLFILRAQREDYTLHHSPP